MKYKFRAELLTDAMLCQAALSRWIDKWSFEVLYLEPRVPEEKPARLPDVEVTFELAEKLRDPDELVPMYLDLLWIFSHLEDCHVIVETLQPEEKYTGERTHQFADLLQNWKPEWKLRHQVMESLRGNIIVGASVNGRLASNLNNLLPENA